MEYDIVKRRNNTAGTSSSLQWALWRREWYGGHRPDWTLKRYISLEEAVRLVETGRARSRDLEKFLNQSPLHRLAAEADPDQEYPQDPQTS